MNNLRECPFCGGSAEVRESEVTVYNTYIKSFIFCRCTVCGARGKTTCTNFHDYDECIKISSDAWNSRRDDKNARLGVLARSVSTFCDENAMLGEYVRRLCQKLWADEEGKSGLLEKTR